MRTRFQQPQKPAKRRPIKIYAKDVISKVTGMSRNESDSYEKSVNIYNKSFLHLQSMLQYLFNPGPDHLYHTKITTAKEALDKFDEATRTFIDTPTVRRVTRVLLGPFWRINPLRGISIYGKTRGLSGMIEDATRSVVGQEYIGLNVTVPQHLVSGVEESLRFSTWALSQKNASKVLQPVLSNLDKIAREGGSMAAHRYLIKFAFVYSPSHSTDSDVRSLLTLMRMPRVGTLATENLLRTVAPRYIELGKLGAVELYDLIETGNILSQSRVGRSYSFGSQAENIVKYARQFSNQGISLKTVSELVTTLPAEEHRYGLKLFSQNPQYALLYQLLSTGISPSEYTSFLQDYANFQLPDGTSIFDKVNSIPKENTSAILGVIRNPDLLKTHDIGTIINLYPQPVEEQLSSVSIEETQARSTQKVKIPQPIKRTNWIDLHYPEEHPLRPLVAETYKRLGKLNASYRLRQVPPEHMEEFCREVGELPSRILNPLLADEELFEGYMRKIGPDMSRKLEEISSKGNVYSELIDEFSSRGVQLMTKLDRLTSKLDVIDKQDSEQSQEPLYKRVVVWGELNAAKQQDIEKMVQSSVKGSELIFVSPYDDKPPGGDAVLFVTGRGVSHLAYEGAKQLYKRMGSDIYHERRRVGVKSIVGVIQNIQRAA